MVRVRYIFVYIFRLFIIYNFIQFVATVSINGTRRFFIYIRASRTDDVIQKLGNVRVDERQLLRRRH